MDIVSIILIGLALAIDAMAITIANCTTYNGKLTKLKEWSMPICFTLFQMAMPVIGFYLGSLFAKYIQNISGYITAGVFFILAVKIILDNISELKNKDERKEEEEKKSSNLTFWLLIIQGVSTSIDALFVGLTMTADYSSPFIPALIIGATTFVLVSLSLLFGKYLGKIFSKYAGWVGAVILLGLAIKSLVQAIIG